MDNIDKLRFAPGAGAKKTKRHPRAILMQHSQKFVASFLERVINLYGKKAAQDEIIYELAKEMYKPKSEGAKFFKYFFDECFGKSTLVSAKFVSDILKLYQNSDWKTKVAEFTIDFHFNAARSEAAAYKKASGLYLAELAKTRSRAKAPSRRSKASRVPRQKTSVPGEIKTSPPRVRGSREQRVEFKMRLRSARRITF